MFFQILILILLIIALFLLKIYSEDGLYTGTAIPLHNNYKERVHIGSLSYEIKNPSILTYGDLGSMGRMGNQLFEMASTIGIAYRNQCRVVFPTHIKKLPIYELFDLSKFPIEDVKPDKFIREYDNYEEIAIPTDGKIYSLKGYRQTFWYFQDIREHLPSIFPLRNSLSTSSAYIGVHIRRGDYLKSIPILSSLQIFDRPLSCSLEYYRQAIRRIRQEYHLPSYFPVKICTDDPKWVEAHLLEIDLSAELNRENDFECLYSADYLIIPNSTFSLWAGILGKHQAIVAPSIWAMDNTLIHKMLKAHVQAICPSDWKYHHPITGERVEEAYNWSPEEWSMKNPMCRVFRAILMSNPGNINQWFSQN